MRDLRSGEGLGDLRPLSPILKCRRTALTERGLEDCCPDSSNSASSMNSPGRRLSVECRSDECRDLSSECRDDPPTLASKVSAVGLDARIRVVVSLTLSLNLRRPRWGCVDVDGSGLWFRQDWSLVNASRVRLKKEK